MKDITVHIVSHSHWDREWYMPFEKHRIKLVELIDNLIDLFDNDPNFKSFHLDGQTIVLDDYLQIRPQMREKLLQYIREGKLVIGPWYVLQDEFLTSGESNIRNLLVGIDEAKKYGSVCMTGYFPDAFGNAGQMPQILKQAGMKAVYFGRGVKPVGFNNNIETAGRYESSFSEMMWESEDGSSILGILFANWYNNGVEIPTDEKAAETYWQERLRKVGAFASTGHYLLMNGCDHQPVQKDLSKAIEVARKLFPDIHFEHSNLSDYADFVHNTPKKPLSTVRGELTSQQTDGWFTLVNTASAHIHLKQLNQRNQTNLETVAEPLSAMASTLGYAYPHDWFRHAWKTLMQNHPHDSICGCSVDDVNREIASRFERAGAVTDELIKSGLTYLSGKTDTSAFATFDEQAIPFAVVNTTGWERTGTLSAELEVIKEYSNQLAATHSRIKNAVLPAFELIDSTGTPIECKMEDLSARFGYDLPDDKFRKPYIARVLKVTFAAEKVPALGVKSYALIHKAQTGCKRTTLVTGQNQMENSHLKVNVNADGTLDVTVKSSGHVFRDLCSYEDVGDIGNEYIFFQPVNDKPIRTKGLPAEITLLEDESYRACYQITHRLNIPKSADDLLQQEIEGLVTFYDRKAGRCAETVPFEINTFVALEKNGKGIRVRTEFDNPAKDHRLRVLFPSRLTAKTHLADSVFEVVKRDNKPAECWKNPSNCQHQQAFVSIDDGKMGLTIANRGLNEYEILRDGENTIAVTLLRAVGEMGDWGVFPTPEAQCLGRQTLEFEIIPHDGDLLHSGAYAEGYQFLSEMLSAQTAIHSGPIPAEHGFVSWSGTSLTLTGMKRSEKSGDLILRWVNLGDQESTLTVQPAFEVDRVYRSNVLEEDNSGIEGSAGKWVTDCAHAQIVTVGIKTKS